MTNKVGTLDSIHHVAIEVDDLERSLHWYLDRFQCRVSYSDETWALIDFDNMSLALVTPGQHPPHIGFVSKEALNIGQLRTHRDGTRSIYVNDPAGNAVELIDPASVSSEQIA